ncbi:alpha/beta fold hydrolase [Thiopseudomonas alkaliphila]|uniref:Alpha/beta fold hydrolase n=1 Tax=Thiopseudomonas alkaliphila TaxID=1697053 RepID=A0AAW7DMB3_9GAMM|nr:alpha/beta fold hydrolase [Thiopseudomonas alkaliphila]MDM1695120.1 alpha/beta fold hydrolase [Thiopseudomonas alkaliphila]
MTEVTPLQLTKYCFQQPPVLPTTPRLLIKVVQSQPLTLRPVKGVVVLWHGLLCDAGFWLSRRGRGLAAYLAAAGYQVWIPEWQQLAVSGEQLVQHYLSAFLRQLAVSQTPVHLIAHSFGGLLVTRALQALAISAQVPWTTPGAAPFNSLTLLAVQDQYQQPEFFAAVKASVQQGQSLAEILGLSCMTNQTQHLAYFLACYQAKCQPMSDLSPWVAQGFAYSGAADLSDPVAACAQFSQQVLGKRQSYQCLSLEQGYRQDYNHHSLLIGRSAQQEIWPLLLANLNATN